MKSPATIICLLICSLSLASGHGGTLHPGSPETNNWNRVKVATCSDWKSAAGRLRDGKTSPIADRRAPVDVKGTVTLWYYQYKNCSIPAGGDPTAGASFNVTFMRGGKPSGGMTVDGLGMTGSCASGGGSTYYLNPALEPTPEDKSNKLWFTNATVPANGSIAGNGANDGLIRLTAQGADKPAVKSMMLVETSTGALLACCDLTAVGQPTTNYLKALPKGVVCEEEGHGSAHGSAHGGAATKLAAPGGDNATDEHAGHDHGDHAGHDHGDHAGHNMTDATKAAAPAKAKSGASAAVSGVTAACAAVVAAVAVLVL